MPSLETDHQRQLTLLVRAPPISGPKIAEQANTAPRSPNSPGLLAGGATKGIIVYEPPMTPEAPHPCIIRPTMRASLLGAAPRDKVRHETMEPIPIVGIRTRYDTPNLKKNHGRDEDYFDRVKLVQLAPEGRKCSHGQEKAGSIPPHIIQ